MKIPKARKLSSGTWFIQLRLDGKSIPVTGETEALAQAKALSIKAGLTKAEKARTKSTLGGMIDAYIDARSNVLSPATIRGYRGIRRNYFQQLMNKAPNNVNWQAAVNAEARRCSAKSLKNAWGLVFSALRENGIHPDVKLPTVAKRPMPWLTPEQIPLFLRAIQDTPCELPALLGLCSLRRSEIFGLRWENVDLKKGVLRVCESVVICEHGTARKDTTKTSGSTRSVPIMIPRLRELLAGSQTRSGPVCLTHPSTPYNQINRICRANGLPEIGMHGLRRSFASLGYHLGLSELEIMAIGGWSDFQTIHKFYLYLSETDKNAGVKKVADFFTAC